MQECDVQSVSPVARSLVYETYPFIVAQSQSLFHTVFHLECHVVHASAAVVKKLLDGTLGACGFQQFYLHLAYFQECRLYLLVIFS